MFFTDYTRACRGGAAGLVVGILANTWGNGRTMRVAGPVTTRTIFPIEASLSMCRNVKHYHCIKARSGVQTFSHELSAKLHNRGSTSQTGVVCVRSAKQALLCVDPTTPSRQRTHFPNATAVSSQLVWTSLPLPSLSPPLGCRREKQAHLSLPHLVCSTQ